MSAKIIPETCHLFTRESEPCPRDATFTGTSHPSKIHKAETPKQEHGRGDAALFLKLLAKKRFPAVVKRSADLIGGKIAFEIRVPEGSTFTFILKQSPPEV